MKMGVSINTHVYRVDRLLRSVEEFISENGGYREGALPAREFFMKVYNEFGAVDDNKFYVLWNEYYDEYSPASNFLIIIQEYYFPGQDTEFWSDDYDTLPGGVSYSEVLSELFEDEFGYEGKFSNE